MRTDLDQYDLFCWLAMADTGSGHDAELRRACCEYLSRQPGEQPQESLTNDQAVA